MGILSFDPAANPLVAGVTSGVFESLSRLRGSRIFHPNGEAFEAMIWPRARSITGSVLFDRAEPVRAVVRLSRSVGLPESFPDPCGLAIRVPDIYGEGYHQDFLLVSSGRLPFARHLLLPSGGFSARAYSSLLPYDIDGGLRVIGAQPLDPSPGPNVAALGEAARAELRFSITLASPLGAWEEVARLELDRCLPHPEAEALRFSVANSGGGIKPAGFLNRLRLPAYQGSQKGRAAAEATQTAPAGPPVAISEAG